MSVVSLMGQCIEDLLPLMHIVADLRMAKESMQRSQPI